MHHHALILAVIVGLATGMAERLMFLPQDVDQFPTYPHGTVIHLFLGFVASALGALAPPALSKPDFTAGVFLALGASQFHTVRDLERNTLESLDKDEQVPRGHTYIESIAMAFEARNYLVLVSSGIASLLTLEASWPAGIAVGILTMLLAQWLSRSLTIGHLASVSTASCRRQGEELYAGDTLLMEQTPKAEPLVLCLRPHDYRAMITLANPGQQQAMAHHVAVLLGAEKPPGLHSPRAQVVSAEHHQAFYLILWPILHDVDTAILVTRKVPVLEAALRRRLPRQIS